MQRIAFTATIIVLAMVFLFFWFIPYSQRSDLITWAGLFITALCAAILSITFYRVSRTWHGFGALLILHLGAQVWLQWQWDLWNSPAVLIRNLNVVAGLVVWATFVAITVSLMLLLIFRDASVIGLAVVWVGWPVLLIVTALRYHTLDGLNDMPFREQIVLVIPVCLLSFLAIAGVVAFIVHFIWLMIKEVAGREILGEG